MIDDGDILNVLCFFDQFCVGNVVESLWMDCGYYVMWVGVDEFFLIWIGQCMIVICCGGEYVVV